MVCDSLDVTFDAATKVRVAWCTLELDVDSFSLQFRLPKLVIFQAICDVLEQDGRLTEAVQCFQRIQNNLTEDTSTYMAWEVGEWVQGNISRMLQLLSTDFRHGCTVKPENLGDATMDSQRYDEAVKLYSEFLTLNPSNVSASAMSFISEARHERSESHGKWH